LAPQTSIEALHSSMSEKCKDSNDTVMLVILKPTRDINNFIIKLVCMLSDIA